MEEKVLFLPGAVGLQLEPDPQWGSRVVRFVDGGPWDPGPARACGKIHPGDWITCVEVNVNGMEATTFPEMMDLLQQVLCSRTLTVRSFARTVLGSSMDSSISSQNQASANDILPMAVSHQDTVPSPHLFETSLPNEEGSTNEGINNEQNVIGNQEGFVRDGSPPIDPILHHHGNPHLPSNDSLRLTPCWESSTPLLLLLHPWNVSLPLEKQPHHAIQLPPHRRRRLSLKATLPHFFGTNLGKTYSVSIDPRIRVHLVEKHPIHSATYNDNKTHSETLNTTTGSTILRHQPLHERMSTLQPLTSFPGMVSLSSIHPCNTWKHPIHTFGTTLVPYRSFQWQADQFLQIFLSRPVQSSQEARLQSEPSISKMIYPDQLDTLLKSQTPFEGRIALRKRTGIGHNNKPQQSKIRFSLSSFDQAPSSTIFSMDEKEILIQKQRQQSSLSLSTPDSPMVDQNPNLETFPSSTSTQLEMEPTTQEEIADTDTKLKMPTTLKEYESSQVAIESERALSSSPPATSPSTEPTDKTESHPKDTTSNTGSISQPLFEMEKTRAVENECPTAILAQPTASSLLETPPPSNTLLRKAKAKHQLSLARLRVKKSYQTKDAQTIDKQDKDMDKDANEPSNRAETTSQSIIIRESCEPIATTVESPDDCIPTTPHSPKVPQGTLPFVPSTPVIDFARFSQEQTLLFEPGPIGLQLDHCTTDGQGSSDYPAKVVRFIDGGPQDPGPARLSGRIQPGDYVIRVEAEGVVGTTYYTILHLLQKSWTTRKLTFRSAWEPLHVATTIVSPNPAKVASTPITPPRPATLRSMPLKDSAPLPYQWTPLPYDWITRKRPEAITPEEQRALEQAYREEASRIIHERDEQKRRALAEAQVSLQPNQSSWNFGDLVLGAVALTAESVAGCLRKQPLHDSDSDDDEDDHQKRD